jgi:hypothetical protein
MLEHHEQSLSHFVIHVMSKLFCKAIEKEKCNKLNQRRQLANNNVREGH